MADNYVIRIATARRIGGAHRKVRDVTARLSDMKEREGVLRCIAIGRFVHFVRTPRLVPHGNNVPATRNRTRDHLIAAAVYSQMLYQLSYSRLV
jgi:hypothetical protein